MSKNSNGENGVQPAPELADTDFAVLRALEVAAGRSAEQSLADTQLAALAQLPVSIAVASAHKLEDLGLVSIKVDDSVELFELNEQGLEGQLTVPSEELF